MLLTDIDGRVVGPASIHRGYEKNAEQNKGYGDAIALMDRLHGYLVPFVRNISAQEAKLQQQRDALMTTVQDAARLLNEWPDRATPWPDGSPLVYTSGSCQN